MNKILPSNEDYRNWLGELKTRIKQSQIKAAIRVNTELLELYWELGSQIVERQDKAKWGDGLIPQLSKDLMEEFPQMKGFSTTNLHYIRQWYLFYNQDNIIGQQVVDQLEESNQKLHQVGGEISILSKKSILNPDKHESIILQQLVGEFPNIKNDSEIVDKLVSIPWGHNLQIIAKCKTIEEALFYVNKTIENGWSRSMLVHQIELKLYTTQSKSISNFKNTLPAAHSDLVVQTLKDPYIFDFLTLTEKYNERELEDALVENITRFLLELGAGFAYVGRQVPFNVGETDFPIDLLFYHLKLRCYVVIELKTGKFKPEHAGKIGFYLSAADDLLRHPADNPTIGIIICREKNNIVAEYALKNVNQPIGVSEYQLTKAFPENFKGSLPTIEEIEKELKH